MLITTLFSFKPRRDNKKTIKPNKGMTGSTNHDFLIIFREFRKKIGRLLFIFWFIDFLSTRSILAGSENVNENVQ